MTFTFGVVAHPGRASYPDIPGQLLTLKKHGFTTYRFDLNLTSDQNPDALLASLLNSHITLHPILHVPFTWGDRTDNGRYPDSLAGLEQQGYDRAYPIVLKYAKYIQDWEMENELTCRKGFKSGIGRLPTDYQTTPAEEWAAVLRGMSRAVHDAGVKAGHPTRTCVDIVYVDFGFIPLLESNGVKVDKVGYHYYYNGDVSPHQISPPPAGAPHIDLFAELKALGKPVIINEFNAGEIYAPNQGKPYDDVAALKSLRTHLDYILTQKDWIEGVEFYELYDEPTAGAVEGNFGLMKDPATPKLQLFLAATYAGAALPSAESHALLKSLLNL